MAEVGQTAMQGAGLQCRHLFGKAVFIARPASACQEQILGLRMGHSAGSFALLAANAAFRMYEDSFHTYFFLSPSRMKGTSRSCLIWWGTSSLNRSISPGKHKKRASQFSLISLTALFHD
jgi:hypothetical protein